MIELHDGDQENKGYALIWTLEGKLNCYYDDWLIKGIKGEVCPCRDGIFKKSYDLV